MIETATMAAKNEMSSNGDVSPSRSQLMVAHGLVGVCIYLCIEIIVRLLLRCTRLSLYFWACSVDILAIALYVISFLVNTNMAPHSNGGLVVVTEITWWTFKVAQSMVLYSRLDLVMKNRRVCRYMLWTIIFTAVFAGLPAVITSLMNSLGYSTGIFRVYDIFDKAQLTAFFVQETAIGFLYIYATITYLKNRVSLGANRKATRRVLFCLLSVNTFIICIDCTRLGLLYTQQDYPFLQGFYTATVYAVKLRTEFTVLNQLKSTLVSEVRGPRRTNTTDVPPIDAELGAEGHISQGSGIELVDRTGIEKKVVFTMTSHEDLRESEGGS
ncbi:hypothetical protein HBI38_178420 [Parastagonospora nodorum]|nr:hypothetical protein HBI09_081180 [Parastagonospora nodorum]KAH4218139.1 hypothetical protein HBI06_206840 [Parastagonospora nodorum]KAH4242994.1 hypothetical protein HBI05_092060 [Parastagonospora nodorum]KAH4804253.1 hypothetical protein HBH61_175910 [Parastagonospora nodorum]KAH4988387.1 hypothetical protein HBI76_088540 [Parastagonospora nodorum]